MAGIDRDWAIAARDEHRERIAACSPRLADEAATPAEALRRARALVRHDPLSEDAARRLMRRLADAGDRAAAMAEYVRLETRLDRELPVAPSRADPAPLAEIRTDAPPPLGTADGARRSGPTRAPRARRSRPPSRPAAGRSPAATPSSR